MVKVSSFVVALLSLAASTTAMPIEDFDERDMSPVVPRDLLKRKVSCWDGTKPEIVPFGRTSDAVECINYLASLGSQKCVATVSGQSFCRRGGTQITGIAVNTKGNTATSTCQEVARGAGFIMDRCSRSDGTVRGQNEAWANGHLLVDIRRNP